MKVQRLRVTFTRLDDLQYVTHLDMMRLWERALRRAGIPVAYSEGFSPHPQIALAAPLAVGVTSECELMDVFLEETLTPRAFIERTAPQLPPALAIVDVREAGMALPSLQADVRAAEYLVDAPAPDALDVDAAVRAFLAAETVPWQHMRDDEVRSYDLRTLVFELESMGGDGGDARLRMLLRNDNSGSGRPEQVALALGLGQPARIHRVRLVLAETSPARAAYRAHGRYES